MIEVKVGDKFIADIYGEYDVEGVIQIENDIVFLCQDRSNGGNCKDKLGYKYSWNICKIKYFNERRLSSEYVTNFKLLNRKSRIENLNI